MGYQALLFCPDEKTARAISQVLSELDFSIEPCTEPFGAVKRLMAQRFDAVVVDCDNEQNAMLLFKSARNSGANQAALAVAVVEGQAGVAKAFRIGANLVLTKPINVEQAKGTLRVARGLLRKGSEAAPPASPQTPSPARPSAAPVSAAPPRSTAPVFPPARSAAPAPKPAKAPPPPGVPAQSAGAGQDADTIFEPGAASASAPPVRARQGPPAGGKSNYPWQRAARPAGEPMASAMRKAAEVGGQEKAKAPAKPVRPAPPAVPVRQASAPALSALAAAAPAPAREEEAVKPRDIPAPTLKVESPKPQGSAGTGSAPLDPPPAKALVHPEVEPPSFTVGSSDWEEGDEGSKKKAIAIVAAVLLLGASAAYLGWRNTRANHSAPPSVTQPAPVAAPSENAPDQKSDDSVLPTRRESVPPMEEAAGKAPATSAKTSPAIKAQEKEPSGKAASEARELEPAPEPLVVKRDSPRANQPDSSAPAAESVQPPSSVAVTGTGDTQDLASISNVAVGVPKPAPDVVKISQGVSEGLVLKRVAPKYPPQAIQMRIQGPVEMQATISKQGTITNLKVLTGDSILARAAVEAVKQWKYKPYYLNGEPVDIQTMITVNFRLPN